jgi:predicted outer membrane repeat protein
VRPPAPKAGNGGAIYASSTNPGQAFTVTDTKFDNNRASSDGGAVYNSSTKAVFQTSEFKNNQAGQDGGAIHQKMGTLLVDNCGGFATNIALGAAGAHHICNQGFAPITLWGNTVATIVAVP